jgi:hypothetical protein
MARYPSTVGRPAILALGDNLGAVWNEFPPRRTRGAVALPKHGNMVDFVPR